MNRYGVFADLNPVLSRRLVWPTLMFSVLAVAAYLSGCEGKRDGKVALPAQPPAVQKVEGASETPDADTPELSQNSTAGSMAASTASQPASSVASPKSEISRAEAPRAISGSSDTGGRLTGEVAATRRSQLAFKQQGFIQIVKTKAGSVIKKGEVLAKLETQDFELRLDLAKARKEQGRVGLASADKELRRERQLASENASTATALDRVQAQFDQAKLAVKLAELDVTSAQRALDDAELIAPYDCVVADQLKDEADYVRPGDVVFTVYDTQLPEIRFAAPERLMGKITVGDTLQVLVPSAGYSGRAEIVRVVPIINERTRTFQVIAKPQASDQRIVPGSYAEALLN